MEKKLIETEILFEKLCKANNTCSCGRQHKFTLKKFILHEGALAMLPEVIDELGTFENIVMICDNNTYEVAGATVEKMCRVHTVCLNSDCLHANEHGVAAAENMMPKKCDLLLAVGSGTVHDITRYIAYGKGINFVSVPTAASVDGFVSSVAAMTWEGVKRTMTAVSPIAMVADSEILAKAPAKLTAAGVGDLLGKYIALFDWKLAHILTGEYYCSEIAKMEEDALEALVGNIQLIASGSPKATEVLMYGLVLSGIAMQMADNSRPASGAEHHISHCIEMEVFNGTNDALHGEKVGVATCMLCDVYHELAKKSKDELGFSLANGVSNEEIMEVFAKVHAQIIAENRTFSLPDNIEQRLLQNWDEICALIAEIPSGDEIRKLLQVCGGSITLESIGLSDALKPMLLRYSPLVRNRLTLMRMGQYFT